MKYNDTNILDSYQLDSRVCHTIRACIDKVIDLAPNGSIFVESGVYLGYTTLHFVQKLIESKKDFKYYCVDNFLLDNVPERHENNLDFFKKTIKDYIDYVEIINSDAIQAIDNFEDDSVFFAFLDDCHIYNHVTKQIKLWIPKLKDFSILAGDDYYSIEVKRAVLDNFNESDIISLHQNSGFLIENPIKKVKNVN